MDPTVTDPIGLLAAGMHLIATYFPAVAPYVPAVMGYAGMFATACVLIAKYVKPPSASAPKWWIVTYRVINVFAGNGGHAINATPPGLPAPVRDASITAAKATAAAPELATVAVEPATKLTINPGA